MRVSMNKRLAVASAAALILGLSQQSRAGWTLTWLEVLDGYEESVTEAMSTDGPALVGYSSRGYYEEDQQCEATLWTESAGAVGLGFLPGHAWSEAHDVSADGSVVVGYSQADVGQHVDGEAFRWTQSGGMTSLGVMPGHATSWANGVSADGSVVVGTSGGWGGKAFRWTQSGGMVDLGCPAGGFWSVAHAVSADGSVVVGDWAAEGAWEDGFRWTEADGMVSLGSGGVNYIHDVSADGSVVVGMSLTLGAVFWTEEQGLVALGDLAEFPDSRAEGVSEDGSLIVGTYDSGAFLWDATNGMRDLTELLIADGVDLAGRELGRASDVSLDGQRAVVVGTGYDPSVGFRGWVAVIPEPSTFTLLAMGTLGLLLCAWRRRRQ